MFQKSLIAAAIAGVMAIGLSAAPANAWHKHKGGVVITLGHGFGYGHNVGHRHKHCHVWWKNGHKVKKCHKHRHHGGHHY